LFDPALLPFTFHWYDGVDPPFVGVAINVTETPGHTWFADATIETLTSSNGLTIMVTMLEVAGFPMAQVALEVNTQVTTSLLSGLYE